MPSAGGRPSTPPTAPAPARPAVPARPLPAAAPLPNASNASNGSALAPSPWSAPVSVAVFDPRPLSDRPRAHAHAEPGTASEQLPPAPGSVASTLALGSLTLAPGACGVDAPPGSGSAALSGTRSPTCEETGPSHPGLAALSLPSASTGAAAAPAPAAELPAARLPHPPRHARPPSPGRSLPPAHPGRDADAALTRLGALRSRQGDSEIGGIHV